MYHHLDNPPPQSQFRRPWSPEPFNPYPPSSTGHGHESHPELYPQQHHRETSDVSLEALDLADYALSLNPVATQSRCPEFRINDIYPPSPPPVRPLVSRTSLQAPSLVSAGTVSHTTSSRSPIHRPFSLPLPSRSRASLHGDVSVFAHSPNYPHIASPSSVHVNQAPQAPDPEIDIAQFPAWSRNWYDTNHPTTPPSPYNDPLRSLHPESTAKLSPFDPGYSYLHHGPQSHKYPTSDESSRDMLPWSGETPSSGPPVDAEVKEERLRMLQREFGDDKARGGRKAGYGAEEIEPAVVGSVNAKGQLVTEGPRKRVAMRLLQGLLALGSGVSSIYGAVIIKPIPAAPPAGKLPAYILYVLSVLTFFLVLYFFVFRPCCCSGRRSSSSNFTGGMPGMPGMMILPVQGGMSGMKGGKGRQGKGMGPDVHVNLIVDPGMLQGPPQDDYANEEFDESGSVPGSYSPYGTPIQNPQRRNRPRRSVFAGLAMEEQWRAARSTLKIAMFLDVVCLILWGAEFVLILLGKRCPSGSFGGWCNAYNAASAGACLLCVAFGISVVFDVKDLHASKASPRTRP